MKPQRLVVLISGNGSNLQAILDACHSLELNAQVVAVISNKADAYGLERARQAGIPTEVKLKYKTQDRCDYDRALADLAARYQPDYIILAGWMRLLSLEFLSRFSGRVINLHPALPGTFAGTHAIERAFEAFQTGQIASSGVMVHYVLDEGVDNGPVIAQRTVPIRPEDTLEIFEARMHACEHVLLISALQSLFQPKEKENA
jgi:formyltetrahydrofolate-dependent phosphoribosylglycinamide formyltransferase